MVLLGPILFILYINDLPATCKDINFKLFSYDAMAVLRRCSNGHCPVPSLMVYPLPPVVLPQFFALALLPMYNVINSVDGWKWLKIINEIMN